MADFVLPAFSRSLRAASAAAALATFAADAAAAAQGGADELAAVKQAIMTADYQADLDGLRRGAQAAGRLARDPERNHLAWYWAGFAEWRLAINGVNRARPASEIEAALRRSLPHFDSALVHRPDFTDAHAAAAGVASWLYVFTPRGSDERRSLGQAAREHLGAAVAADSLNPRVEWVRAGILWNLPPAAGGSRTQALSLYQRAARAGPQPRAHAAPDWGHAEAIMGWSWALANGDPPDPDAAESRAREALTLRPDWFYVSEVLLPQIRAVRLRSRAGAGP